MAENFDYDFDALYGTWRDAKQALEELQNMVDQRMKSYLEGSAEPPSRHMVETIHDLIFREQEARDNLDQFILEHAI